MISRKGPSRQNAKRFDWPVQVTSWIILLCGFSVQQTAATEVFFICYSQPAGTTTMSELGLLVTETVEIADGYRTCTFKMDREYKSYMRLQVDITPDKSPECDSDVLLQVGEDVNSLQKVCGNQTYSKRFLKSFVVQYKQNAVNPTTNGVKPNVTKIEYDELLRCNKTFWNQLETNSVTVSETFQPGEIELPYYCWWKFSYPFDKNANNRLIVNINSVELEPSTTVGSKCGNNSLILRDGWEVSHELVFESCQNDSYDYFTKGLSAFVEVRIDEPSNLPFNFNVSVTAFSLIECYGQVITLKATNEVKLLESPGYPTQVPQFMKCRWQVESEDGNEVEVEIVDMNIDDHCNKDKLKIFDGDQQLVSMCYPPRNTVMKYRSSNQKLLVYLETDDTNYGRGFTMNYYTKKFPSSDLPTESTCRTNTVTLIADSTERYIVSPAYPGAYPNHQACEWIVTSDDGNNVEVEIVDMNITPGINCFSDSLKIYDGSDVNKSPLTNLCGKIDGLKGKKFRSSGDGLKLTFTSQNPGGRNGFRLKYYTKSEPSSDLANVTSCRGKLIHLNANKTHQYIETEDYPSSTLIRNEDCRWLIHAPGERIEVNIVGLNLGENPYINRLTIIEGRYYSENFDDGTAQIVISAGKKYQSHGEYLMIRYNTDRLDNNVLPNKGGFRLSYWVVDPPTPTTDSGQTTGNPGGAGNSVLNTKLTLVTALVTTMLVMFVRKF